MNELELREMLNKMYENRIMTYETEISFKIVLHISGTDYNIHLEIDKNLISENTKTELFAYINFKIFEKFKEVIHF